MNGLHHVHTRKRIYQNLEQYPSPSLFKRLLDRAIYAAAVATPLALVPQVVQVYMARDASGLSFPTWGLLFGIGLLWLLYGIVHREAPLIVTHTALMMIHVAIIVAILLY
ncbi:MAG: PQ-loop domain-containing transporter [Patescibacteria group bacterium]